MPALQERMSIVGLTYGDMGNDGERRGSMREACQPWSEAPRILARSDVLAWSEAPRMFVMARERKGAYG